MVHATQAASPSSSVTVDISLRLGIDLAKNVFELVQVKDRSTVVFNKRLNREQLTALVMKLPPQRIVMEACATSTWWAHTASEPDARVSRRVRYRGAQEPA